MGVLLYKHTSPCHIYNHLFFYSKQVHICLTTLVILILSVISRSPLKLILSLKKQQ